MANQCRSSVLGQLLFGYLADRYGRTRLYGIELVLVIVSTIGVATTSSGYGDISFLALFTWVCSAPIEPSSLPCC
jgi:PHS family inorganic phosphate transporter-like MFS transporter